MTNYERENETSADEIIKALECIMRKEDRKNGTQM